MVLRIAKAFSKETPYGALSPAVMLAAAGIAVCNSPRLLRYYLTAIVIVFTIVTHCCSSLPSWPTYKTHTRSGNGGLFNPWKRNFSDSCETGITYPGYYFEDFWEEEARETVRIANLLGQILSLDGGDTDTSFRGSLLDGLMRNVLTGSKSIEGCSLIVYKPTNHSLSVFSSRRVGNKSVTVRKQLEEYKTSGPENIEYRVHDGNRRRLRNNRFHTLMTHFQLKYVQRTSPDGSADSKSVYLQSVRDGLWIYLCKKPTPIIQYIIPFLDLGRNKTDGSFVRGLVLVNISISSSEINQCDHPLTNPPKLAWHGTHRCKPSTTCVHDKGKGFRRGSYLCQCKEGYSKPGKNLTDIYFDGTRIDTEYQKKSQGLPNTYGDDFTCSPCTNCEECSGSGNCEGIVGNRLLYWILMGVASVDMFAVLVLFGMTWRFREDMVIKASSPGLLFVTLFGSFILYCEVLVAALPASDASCHVRAWIRHVGFAITYGALVMKTWRISIIMREFKSRKYRIQDTELYKKLCLLLGVFLIYLSLWTGLQPIKASHVVVPIAQGEHVVCELSWWDFAAMTGELIFLLWGVYVCFRARMAPSLYNETRYISYGVWNEAMWLVFLIMIRILLRTSPDEQTLLVIRFIRTQLTVTILLAMIFGSKFYTMFRNVRKLKGTLTEVYGSQRIHRLSLMVNKKGDIKTIYCTPCGPLAYMEPSEETTAVTSPEEEQEENYEEESYTQAEMDKLLTLVSKLKSEKELYKMQVKHLQKTLRNHKRRTSLANSSVSEWQSAVTEFTSCNEGSVKDMSLCNHPQTSTSFTMSAGRSSFSRPQSTLHYATTNGTAISYITSPEVQSDVINENEFGSFPGENTESRTANVEPNNISVNNDIECKIQPDQDSGLGSKSLCNGGPAVAEETNAAISESDKTTSLQQQTTFLDKEPCYQRKRSGSEKLTFIMYI